VTGTPASAPLLDIRDLSVSFEGPGGAVPAVRHVSLDVRAGETVALVGESGSGKSVTALSILQLLPYPLARHPSGSIRFRGEELIGAPEAVLRRSEHGRYLIELGFGEDLPLCARIDSVPVVPVVRDGRIRGAG